MPPQGGPSTNGNGGTAPIANAGVSSPGALTRTGRAAVPVDWERLARATAHPLRVSILEIIGIDGGRTLSPSDLSHELQIALSNTNYHVTELAKAGLIELIDQRQVRGATEHFYRLPAEPAARDERRRRHLAVEAAAREPVGAS